MEVEDAMWKEKYEELLRKYDEAERKIGEMLAEVGKPREHERKLEEEIKKLKNDNANLKKAYDITVEQLREACDKLERFRNFENALIGIVEAARPQGFESATSMPSEINVQREVPALTVQVIRKPLVLSTDNAQGRLALLYAEGFFDEEERTISAIQKEMIRRGWPKDPRLSGFLDEMCSWGYLRKRRTDRWLYQAAIKSTEARSKGLLKEVEIT
jgi:chromosome segregation ATPase